MQQKEGYELIKWVLPFGILEYFDFIEVKQTPATLHIYLAEKNVKPQEYAHQRLTSKGFFDDIQVQDFPIRAKNVFLVIKRRRWYNEDTGNAVFRDWNMVAKGTRMTEDFASFLKVIARYPASEL